MEILRVDSISMSELLSCDFSVDIDQIALPPFDKDTLHSFDKVESYRKTYPVDSELLSKPVDQVNSMITVVKQDNILAGYIVVLRSWNNCGQIEDFAIDRKWRRNGFGRHLIDAAVKWAVETGLPTLRLETQSNNVNACMFYQRCGFKLGGFDRYIYAALPGPERNETALFWYRTL
jgi:ribosomal protein S18 acetylase RimI-like enzyme